MLNDGGNNMITKTRKQGNSIMLTVPKEFDVPNGVEVEAKLVCPVRITGF